MPVIGMFQEEKEGWLLKGSENPLRTRRGIGVK